VLKITEFKITINVLSYLWQHPCDHINLLKTPNIKMANKKQSD
ncbi:MAG: hypothetical protein RI934_527, partial [Bacteroidota bacterium]